MARFAFSALMAILGWSLVVNPVAAKEFTSADLIKMDFEDLVNLTVRIESAGKSVSSALDLAYAGYVITANEILTSGVQTIPDALRLVPGLEVGQISAAEWSVGIRGAGGRYSRYVLVMVDNRIVYNNVFAGVNWDELNINLNQIARIEVIRGPNGSAWGANAVNGIIHIITQRPERGQRSQLSGTVGDQAHANANAVLSVPLSKQWHAGVGISSQHWDGLTHEQGLQTDSDHSDYRLSLSAAHETANSNTYLKADFFGTEQAPLFSWPDLQEVVTQVRENQEQKTGIGIQGSHKRFLANNAYWKIRGSAENINRDATLYLWNGTNVQMDLELGFQLGDHNIVTGLYDHINNAEIDYRSVPGQEFNPTQRTISTYGLFVNDTIAISDHWTMNLGLRLDDSDLGKGSLQSSLRNNWRLSETSRIWLAASESYTSPPRALVDGHGIPYALLPADDTRPAVAIVLDAYLSEPDNTRLRAWELGYRKASGVLSLDAAFFRYEYQNEIGVIANGNPELVIADNFQPFLYQRMNYSNSFDYTTQGGELVLRAKPSANWSTQFMVSRVEYVEGADSSSTVINYTNSFKLSDDLDWFFALRYSHGSTAYYSRKKSNYLQLGIPDTYLVADTTLTWTIDQQWRIAVIARNLGRDHSEALREQFSTDILLVEPNAMINLSYSY